MLPMTFKYSLPKKSQVLLPALIFSLAISPAWSETANTETANKGSSPVALPPAEDGATMKPGEVHMKMTVPQFVKPDAKFTAYPYTTKPMKMAIPIVPLADDKESIKAMLLNSGYENKLSLSKPYPDMGWRWQYAYNNALKKSHLSPPKLLVSVYPWRDKMVKYVLPEIKRINDIENARVTRYYQLLQDYEDNHKDEEMEAIRRGQEPLALRLRPLQKDSKVYAFASDFKLTPGEWWITGQHKTPGLVYYWQYPITVNEGGVYNITLDDSNATLIQGGW